MNLGHFIVQEILKINVQFSNMFYCRLLISDIKEVKKQKGRRTRRCERPELQPVGLHQVCISSNAAKNW